MEDFHWTLISAFNAAARFALARPDKGSLKWDLSSSFLHTAATQHLPPPSLCLLPKTEWWRGDIVSRRIKLDSIRWGFKVKIYLMLFPGESFPFCAPRKVPTHLSFHRLFLCIFSLIPLLIQALISQRLSAASAVGINLAERNFRARLLLRPLPLLHFFFFSALDSFSSSQIEFSKRDPDKGKELGSLFSHLSHLLITVRPPHRCAGYVVILSPAAHGREWFSLSLASAPVVSLPQISSICSDLRPSNIHRRYPGKVFNERRDMLGLLWKP